MYGKTPEQFIKRLRESQNQKELDDNEHEIDEYETSENSSGQAIGSYQTQAINQGNISIQSYYQTNSFQNIVSKILYTQIIDHLTL